MVSVAGDLRVGICLYLLVSVCGDLQLDVSLYLLVSVAGDLLVGVCLYLFPFQCVLAVWRMIFLLFSGN